MTTKDDTVGPGPASAPDLDVWRAEAGEAAGWAAYGIRDGIPFGSAARTGWPRDAARVGVLCERVAALEAALLDAADMIENVQDVIDGEGISSLEDDKSTRAKSDALRAIAAGGAPKGESR